MDAVVAREPHIRLLLVQLGVLAALAHRGDAGLPDAGRLTSEHVQVDRARTGGGQARIRSLAGHRAHVAAQLPHEHPDRIVSGAVAAHVHAGRHLRAASGGRLLAHGLIVVLALAVRRPRRENDLARTSEAEVHHTTTPWRARQRRRGPPIFGSQMARGGRFSRGLS